jgi:hypothetical protein
MKKFLKFSIATIPILVGLFFNQGYYLSRNPYPYDDQADYLKYAISIKENGGVFNFPLFLASNGFSENRKHPLYSLLLSPLSSKSTEFFSYAKGVNLIITILLLFTVYIVGFFSFGFIPALISAVVFATNKFILEEFSLVVPDSLFTITTAVSWYFYSTGFVDENSRLKRVVFGSIFCALGFLAKPAGILVFSSYIISFLILFRKEKLKIKLLATSIFIFMSVCSPLLIRNAITYKNPLYNNNTSLLWIDNRQERRAEDFKTNPPTLVDYFRTHSIRSEMVTLVKNARRLPSNISLIILFEVQKARFVFLLLLIMFLGMVLDKNRSRAVFSFILFWVFFLFFSYNFRVSPHYRHLIPISTIFLYYPLYVIQRMIGGKKTVYIFVLLCSFVPLIIALKEKRVIQISSLDFFIVELPSDQKNFLSFAKSAFSNNTQFVLGNEERLSYDWMESVPGKKIAQPFLASFKDMEDFLLQNNVNFIVVGPSTVFSFPEVYSRYFLYDSGRVKVLETPQNWKLVFTSPKVSINEDPRFLVYEITK